MIMIDSCGTVHYVPLVIAIVLYFTVLETVLETAKCLFIAFINQNDIMTQSELCSFLDK